MQTLRYLAPNRIDVLANEAGHITEYRPVYSRNLQVYKGIDNVLEFRLINPDQKPLDLDRYEFAAEGRAPKFVAFDENGQMIIERDGVNLQSGDSSSYTNKGLFSVTITENDLLNVKDQYLSYNIYLTDYDGTKVLTYANEWFDSAGVIKVSGSAFPGPSSSYNVGNFLPDNGVWYSEALDAQPGINGNEALHTAAVYTDGYTGDVVVQATLENQVTGTTSWADVTSVTLTGTETEPTPINFNGVFNHLRFKTSANPANTVTKILVRN